MSPLPLLKIGSLLVKTIAKPVAKRIKESAHNHPRVRNLCIGLGRVIHYATTHMEVNLRQGKVISVRPSGNRLVILLLRLVCNTFQFEFAAETTARYESLDNWSRFLGRIVRFRSRNWHDICCTYIFWPNE